MARVGFVACSKTKSTLRVPAAALYTSPLFRKSLLAAFDRSERVYILSAKHGLLACNDIIEPYDVALKTMKRTERLAWGSRTGAQLDKVLKQGDSAVLLCGEEYLAPLRPDFERLKVKVETPLGARSLGSRLSFLTELNGEPELRAMATCFFKLMRHVWVAQSGGRRIGEANGRQHWPARGVYFILASHGVDRGKMPRVVRIGTHAVSHGSRTTLWDRLSTHRGTSAGAGSHRSSIFRSHVGRAWTQFEQSVDWPSSWAQGQSASKDVRTAEQELERKVSSLIGSLQVIWLDVDDEPGANSERAYLERNAIGLLSRLGLLRGSAERDWLGHYSTDWRIGASGLWNLNHVFRLPDRDFIDRLTTAVERTIGRRFRGLSPQVGEQRQNQFNFLLGKGEK